MGGRAQKGDGEETSPFSASCPDGVSVSALRFPQSWGLSVVLGDCVW